MAYGKSLIQATVHKNIKNENKNKQNFFFFKNKTFGPSDRPHQVKVLHRTWQSECKLEPITSSKWSSDFHACAPPPHKSINVKTTPHIGAGELSRQVQAFASQAWPEFNPCSLWTGGKREPTLWSCSLMSTCMLWPTKIISKQTNIHVFKAN